ncbi:MAG: IS66 family transposase [bacterium]
MTKRKPRRLEVGRQELEAILERTRGSLSLSDYEKLKAAVDTLGLLTSELEAKGTSIERLRRLIFGSSTEKTSRVLGTAGEPNGPIAGSEEKKKRPGHGRNGVAAYRGAEKIPVTHASLAHGDRCPACARGKVYTQAEPAALLRVKGMAPLSASVYELQRLRCNACGDIFTAEAPAGVGGPKYDETAAAMIALLKYGAGVPFYRLQKLENSLGIPLPAATQWEVVASAAGPLGPAYEELIRQAAQGEVVHNDDTTMKILELAGPPQPEPGAKERTGIFTSGIVSTVDGQKVALFFTGRNHAGENLEQVLAQRAQELPPAIQMCDALSRNTTGEFTTIVANCMAHARRQFVDVAGNFPDECRHVLETLRDVYRNDGVARERKMSAAERLTFHQQQSGPLMDGLETWLREQIEEQRVEPNSGLGEAITYMRKHWPKLTLFLRQAGAPLDNNICERALKKAILHRKNALFYKTANGARVGDLFMSLIHTAELGDANPFDYLVTLQRHARQLAQNPSAWMPWNYQATRAQVTTGRGPPA